MGKVQNQTVSTGLPGLLSGLGTALVVTRSQLAIGAAILLVIAGATLALATVMLSSQRQAEAALLRSRGASRWQLAGSGVAEAALLVLPALIVSPLLAGLLLPPLARHGPLSRSGLRLPVAFPAAAWVAAAAVAAGCLVVIALPWLRTAGSPVRERAQRGRRGALGAATRAGADLGLLVLAGLAGWQLVHYAAPVSTGLSGSIGIDPVLVSAPVLALAAGAVILLRLLPLVVRLGDRAAGRGRDMTTAVAAWQISRRPLRQAGPVLLAVLAVATSVLAVAQWSSWQRSAQDQASFAAGADERVDLSPQAPLTLGQVAALTGAHGVTGSTPVIRASAMMPNSTTATLLALDARPAASVAAIRPDLVGGSPTALLDRLSPAADRPAAIPGRAGTRPPPVWRSPRACTPNRSASRCCSSRSRTPSGSRTSCRQACCTPTGRRPRWSFRSPRATRRRTRCASPGTACSTSCRPPGARCRGVTLSIESVRGCRRARPAASARRSPPPRRAVAWPRRPPPAPGQVTMPAVGHQHGSARQQPVGVVPAGVRHLPAAVRAPATTLPASISVAPPRPARAAAGRGYQRVHGRHRAGTRLHLPGPAWATRRCG